jgi:PTS system ascorbate-specific IIB component
MKKIMTVCGTGLGSSFFVEMNISNILKKHQLEKEYVITHSALFDVDWMEVDYAVVARDIADCIPVMVKKIVLNSIIDMEELEDKLLQVLEEG